MAVTCPVPVDILNDDECLENRPGLGTDIYIGLKSELTKPLVATENFYALAEGESGQKVAMFQSGKGLYKVQCKDDAQQIQGSSLGYRRGFELTCNFIVDSVNPAAGKLARAINNRDIFIIALDGEQSQIMYDPQRKVKFDSGAITTDTGTDPQSDRQSSYSAKLSPVNYPNLYIETPDGGWDSLLANKKNS